MGTIAPALGVLGSAWLGASGPHDPPIPGYRLVWSDEFEGNELDATKWKAWALGPRRDAVTTPDAPSLDGEGHLAITTSRRRRAGGRGREPPRNPDGERCRGCARPARRCGDPACGPLRLRPQHRATQRPNIVVRPSRLHDFAIVVRASRLHDFNRPP